MVSTLARTRRFYSKKSIEQQAMMTAKTIDKSNKYQYNIIIDKL